MRHRIFFGNLNMKIIITFSANYGVNYMKKFSVVLNALDNRAARNQVNRVCLAADVPLVESGTSGYFGQVRMLLISLYRFLHLRYFDLLRPDLTELNL